MLFIKFINNFFIFTKVTKIIKISLILFKKKIFQLKLNYFSFKLNHQFYIFNKWFLVHISLLFLPKVKLINQFLRKYKIYSKIDFNEKKYLILKFY